MLTSGCPPCLQRAQAILALKCCALRSSVLVRDHLLALYHGPRNPAPVRMAAVSLLTYSRPSLALWQRLAISTHYEPNLAVSAYVWATIKAFAEMRDPAFHAQYVQLHQLDLVQIWKGISKVKWSEKKCLIRKTFT